MTRKVPEIINNTTFAEEQIKSHEKIGFFKNNWRQRNVSLYAHPDNDEVVITIGEDYDGAKTIIVAETKVLLKQYIGTFNKVFN